MPIFQFFPISNSSYKSLGHPGIYSLETCCQTLVSFGRLTNFSGGLINVDNQESSLSYLILSDLIYAELKS